jgi:hypothetical protein
MQIPDAPEGWIIREWNYQGEQPVNYQNSNEDVIVLRLERLLDNESVWLEAKVNAEGKHERFNAYRSGKYEVPHLDPLLETANQGIEFCLMVASNYMDLPTEQIPGAREGFYRTLKQVSNLARELGIKEYIIKPRE